jgi:hypothetical protein
MSNDTTLLVSLHAVNTVEKEFNPSRMVELVIRGKIICVKKLHNS